MARITLRQLLDHAAEHDYGVPAFNINNMEQALAVMAAANDVDAPAIIQISRGARAYANDVMLRHMLDALTEIYPQIPVCVHLDHGNEPATCITAMQAGFTSVMMDGSLRADGKTASDWAYNVAVTKTVSEMAHLGGIVLGSLETGSADKEDGHGAEGKLSRDQLLTDPGEAVKFVQETKVDALAIAMGTSHGAYKFSRPPDGTVLAMHVIEEVHTSLPNLHLVMHGSSSVPQELQDVINNFGGKIKPTWGVSVQEIQRGIKHGVRKINIDTDNRLAMTGEIRRVLAEDPSEFDPRKYLKAAMKAMQKLCKQRFEEFNTAGRACKIKRIATPAEMAARAGPKTCLNGAGGEGPSAAATETWAGSEGSPALEALNASHAESARLPPWCAERAAGAMGEAKWRRRVIMRPRLQRRYFVGSNRSRNADRAHQVSLAARRHSRCSACRAAANAVGGQSL